MAVKGNCNLLSWAVLRNVFLQQGISMALDTPSSSAGAGPLADEDGLGALEAVERLEGSPPPEDHMQQPLHPGKGQCVSEPHSCVMNPE